MAKFRCANCGREQDTDRECKGCYCSIFITLKERKEND